MVDQAPAASAKTNGTAAPKPSGQLSDEGRKRIAAAQKAAHKKGPRNTTPLSPAAIKRLRASVKGGMSVVEAAKQEKVGYSTAQRYLRDLPKKATKGKNGKVHRLSDDQIKLIKKMLPRMGPDLRAEDIAAHAKCHISSVYHYRKQMLGGSTSARPARTDTPPSAQDVPLTLYADLKHLNKRAWEDCWDKRIELTDAEIAAVTAWRRINASRE